MGNRMQVMAAIAVLALSGCAGVPQAPTSSGLDLGADKTFVFKDVDADGNKISDKAIANAMEQAIYGGTRFRRRFEQWSSDHVMLYVKGMEAVQQPGGIKVSYVNGERDVDTGKVSLTRSSAVFAYVMETGGDTIKVKVSAPKQLETVKQTNMLFIPYTQLASDEKLAGDLQQIYNGFTPAVLIDKWISGEINSPYSVDAITANFKRKCPGGAPRGTGGLMCMVDGSSVNVDVTPYKEGSKVAYKFMVQYRLNGNGESSYSAEATNKKIANLEKIVKD